MDGDQHPSTEDGYGEGSRHCRHVVKRLHLTGKGAAVLGCEFVRVVDEGTCTVNYLN